MRYWCHGFWHNLLWVHKENTTDEYTALWCAPKFNRLKSYLVCVPHDGRILPVSMTSTRQEIADMLICLGPHFRYNSLMKFLHDSPNCEDGRSARG